MLRFKQGDTCAFEILFSRHKVGVYNFLYRFLNQTQSADEAIQEVFLKVVRASHSYVPTAKFTTWLYTMARNYCIDQSRKQKFRKTTSLSEKENSHENEGLSLEERIPDAEANTALNASAMNLSQKLEKVLNDINPDQREVFLLREKQGFSFEEIAEIVGSSVNTVKSRMRYALISLRDELKKMNILNPYKIKDVDNHT